MCFTNTQNQETAKIAENDIECYKYLRSWAEGLQSPMFGEFYWKEKEINEVDLGELDSSNEIDEGFHSCKTLKNCQTYRKYNDDYGLSIYLFIIPKGAKYFENGTQYVSDKIYLASKEPVIEEQVTEPVEF